MTAADALLVALERNAVAEVEQRRGRARAEAGRIAARAEADIARRRAQYLERLEAEGRERIGREAAASAREARRRVLEARVAVLDRVFERAADLLREAQVEAYAGQLNGLVEDTLRYLEKGKAVLTCRPDLEAPLRSVLGDRAGIRVETRRDAMPGVSGRSVDGRVTVDNTLPGRLHRSRDDLAVALAARLAGG